MTATIPCYSSHPNKRIFELVFGIFLLLPNTSSLTGFFQCFTITVVKPAPGLFRHSGAVNPRLSPATTCGGHVQLERALALR
jgi:hypothetical protein